MVPSLDFRAEGRGVAADPGLTTTEAQAQLSGSNTNKSEAIRKAKPRAAPTSG